MYGGSLRAYFGGFIPRSGFSPSSPWKTRYCAKAEIALSARAAERLPSCSDSPGLRRRASVRCIKYSPTRGRVRAAAGACPSRAAWSRYA